MGRWAEEKVVPLTATWYEYRKFKSDAALLPTPYSLLPTGLSPSPH
ncbi:hypothetical protein [Moorena sp. SIO4G3]|nr:hypothetical protein [Moorena sp. SIO4G3]NEO79090.1 hypothetical protein [Moorena sp. SIO4G3]